MTSPSRQLIERLLQPDCYPHPVDRIEVKETHISWVLLTGQFAYKIKKPVKLDFLDFSTLERRRFFCDEELRLNRRFAPDIYLTVVPIQGPPTSPRIGAIGAEPVEYAVKLAQFRVEEELTELLARDAVRAQDLEDLGDRLADIHAAAASTREFGSLPQTQRLITANIEELARLIDREQHQLERISTWLERNFRRLGSLIDSRQQAGRIREGHGDLHVGNVVRLNGRLAPFDCIEFDPELRFIDVVNDAGFLAMDLTARGHASLSYAFLNGWLEGGGDYDGLPLLRLYETYRALVRAKVAALSKNEADVRRYLRVATELCGDRRPRLILTCGLSGSGKTWLSVRLLTQLNAIRVRSDVERKRMAGLKASESSRSLPEGSIYTSEFNERVYARLADVARTGIAAEENIIVDAAFLRRTERTRFMNLAHELNVPFHIIHCTAPAGVLRARLTKREQVGNDASEANASVLERQLAWWESFTEIERSHVIEIDTSMPDSVARAVRALRSAA